MTVVWVGLLALLLLSQFLSGVVLALVVCIGLVLAIAPFVIGEFLIGQMKALVQSLRR